MHAELNRDLQENNISHAYIFYGDRDTIFQAALDFALALNCLAPQAQRPCGRCRPCILGQKESFSDFMVLRPEKTNYAVKQIRELIKNVQFTAQEGRYRVFLLQDIDKLNDVSANALLKTLEEPAANTVFLLLSDNADKTLATIESRCRIIRWQRVEQCSTDQLDAAYELLTTLPGSSREYIFQLSQNYSNEKDKAKAREKLRALVQGITEILSRNYGNRRSPGEESAYLLNNQQFGDDVLLELWTRANQALEYLEYQVTTPLIAENLFLAMQEKPQVPAGNRERRG